MKHLKTKFSILVILFLLAAAVVTVIQKDEPSYYPTIEEAMMNSGIDFEEIYNITEHRGYSLIFYGQEDILSVGIVTKKGSKYHWNYGFGSKQFNEPGQMVTRAFTNLPIKLSGSNDDSVSLTFGVINDEEIEALKIQYKDQAEKDATIIPTSKGRIWFCYSGTPVNYDPDVVRIYKSGETVNGWN